MRDTAMEKPASPVDWDALDAEIGDVGADHGDFRDDSVLVPVEAVLPGSSDGEFLGTQVPEERSGYFSDEEITDARSTSNMGVFRAVVGDAIRSPSSFQWKFPLGRAGRVQGFPAESEPFSGLRIIDREVSPAALNNILSETRFIRLPAIRTAMMCGKVSGSWATIGIVVEKGRPKLSANGKYFVVWTLGTLEQTTVTIHLFGAAYTDYEKEPLGATLAILNAGIRPDAQTKDPSLSVYKRDQLMKLGMSMDFTFCSGKRRNGTACPTVLNKQLQGRFCQYHASAAKIEFKTSRPELSGGKLALVGPGIQRGYPLKLPDSPVKEETYKKPLAKVSASELQDILSDPEKMPSKASQGKRFLEVMAKRTSEEPEKKGTKRVSSREAAAVKKGKRVAQNDKQMDGTTSRSKPAPDKKSSKTRSKANAEMLEIDMVEDDNFWLT